MTATLVDVSIILSWLCNFGALAVAVVGVMMIGRMVDVVENCKKSMEEKCDLIIKVLEKSKDKGGDVNA